PSVRIHLVQPGEDAAGDVHAVGVALLLEELQGRARATARAAIEVNRALPGHFLPAALELAEGDQRAADVDLVVLFPLAHVDERRFRVFFEDFAQFGRGNFVVDHGFLRAPGAGPNPVAGRSSKYKRVSGPDRNTGEGVDFGE